MVEVDERNEVIPLAITPPRPLPSRRLCNFVEGDLISGIVRSIDKMVACGYVNHDHAASGVKDNRLAQPFSRDLSDLSIRRARQELSIQVLTPMNAPWRMLPIEGRTIT